jgi:hypothetical protein
MIDRLTPRTGDDALKTGKYPLKPAHARRIESAFTHHPPRPESDQVERYAAIRAGCKDLALLLATACPDGRELNSALKGLEEVQSWGIAAIARNE